MNPKRVERNAKLAALTEWELLRSPQHTLHPKLRRLLPRPFRRGEGLLGVGYPAVLAVTDKNQHLKTPPRHPRRINRIAYGPLRRKRVSPGMRIILPPFLSYGFHRLIPVASSVAPIPAGLYPRSAQHERTRKRKFLISRGTLSFSGEHARHGLVSVLAIDGEVFSIHRILPRPRDRRH